jgi:broad specificity phosphatase PhoE
MPHQIFIFRHGETDWNAQERFQGHTDVPLNDRGREQARALAPLLQAMGIETILSSDLSRAAETAKIVAQELGLAHPVTYDAGLREAHLGDAQGLTRLEIESRFGEPLAERWRSWKATDADVSYPGGETGTAIRARVFAALERFVRGNPHHSRIGVACHGGVIRRVMQHLLPEGSEPVPIPNVVVYEIHFDSAAGRWTTPYVPLLSPT